MFNSLYPRSERSPRVRTPSARSPRSPSRKVRSFPSRPTCCSPRWRSPNRQRAWRYALIATVASVIGGMLGYAIGALLYDTVGQWLDQPLWLWREDGRAEADLRPMGLAGDPGQGRDADPL